MMRFNMTKNCISLLLLFSLLVFTGCGSNVGLMGKVVFSDDGSPVPAGMVCLEGDTHFARAVIQPDGTFTVGSLGAKDGLPPGVYRVYISGAEEVVGQTPSGDDIFAQLVDRKFTSPETSGITIDISRTTRDFVIEVDRAPRR